MVVRAQVSVPPQYLDAIRFAEFKYNVPGALIAAVCEDTGWNPNFILFNSDGSVRRIGLAGLWVALLEFKGTPMQGWLGYRTSPRERGCFISVIDRPFRDIVSQITGGLGGAFGLPPYSQAQSEAFIDLAAAMLKDCLAVTTAACGYPNSLLWTRWQGGCDFIPTTCEAPLLPQSYLTYYNHLGDLFQLYCDLSPEFPCRIPNPGEVAPLAVALSASSLQPKVGVQVIFTANVQGGLPPFSLRFDFGDGTFIETANFTAVHTYTVPGAYAVRVTVQDSLGDHVSSSPLTIQALPANGVPPPDGGGIGAGGLALLGLLGLVGLLGLAGAQGGGGGKRQRADKLRQEAQATRAKAQQLRQEAGQLRAQGRGRDADRVEKQAADLERRATELEDQGRQLDFEATREEAERARQQAGVR